MGLFRRVNDIISANLNDLVERFEDPEKMLRQAVCEMEEAVDGALQSASKVIAGERLLAKQLAAEEKAVEQWRQRAADAVAVGDDEAARRALRRKAEHAALAAALADQRASAEEAAGKMRRQVDALRVRLAEARRKQAALIARNRAAHARRKVIRSANGASVDCSAFTRFDRMAGRIEREEAETDALLELTGDALADELPDEMDVEIEAELAALKGEEEKG